MKKVEIIEYEDRYKQDFKYLNYEWIEKSFTVETTDAFILANPVKAIIDKGGYIYFARYENKIVGTFALLKVDEYTFEIAKMAVAQKYQNRGIGKQLMESVMEKAKLLNI